GLTEELLDRVLEAAEQCKRLTRQMLDVAGTKARPAALVDLNEVVNAVALLLDPKLSGPLRLQKRLSLPLPRTRGDAGQLRQVRLTLCLNAGDAMPGGGRRELATEEVVLTPARVGAAGRGGAGHSVRRGVRDTGEGMTAEVQARMFEP